MINIFKNNSKQTNAVMDWREDLKFVDFYGNDELIEIK